MHRVQVARASAATSLRTLLGFFIVTAFASGFVSAPTAKPAVPGLVAAYAFDEGSGSSVADASGSGNTGTVVNATWTSGGKFGSALSFNGISARVDVPNSSSLQLSAGMTLEAWVNPASVSSAWSDVIYKANDNYYLAGSSDSGGVPVGAGTFGGSKGHAYGTSVLPANTWSYLALTYDGAILRLYLNGTLVASQVKTGPIMTSANPLQLGGDSIYGQHFNGLIDEVRIYNQPLSEAAIQTDMTTPVGGGGPSDTQPPSMPTGLTASGVGQSSLTLSWRASNDNVGVTGYRLFLGGKQVATTTATSYTFGGLICGTSYMLGAAAVDAAGNVSGVSATSGQAAACWTGTGAAWYVAAAGSDSNSGTDSAHPFLTFQRACSAAAGGDVVEVAGGSYASQSVSNCSPSSNVTFRPAAGATVNIDGGVQPWVDGLSISGDANLTFQGMNVTGRYGKWGIGGNSTYIVMRDMNTGRFSVGDGSNISVVGGNYGPYYDDQGSGGSHVYPTGQSTLTNLVIDGITMHDYTIPSGSGFHLDCLTVGGGNGVTLKNSTFYNCNGFDAWMKGFPSTAGATNVVFVNNVFRPNLGGTPQVVSLACNDAGAPLANVTIEYNSMGPGSEFKVVGNSPSCTSFSNIMIRANIMAQVNPTDCGKPGVTFTYNVVQSNACGGTNSVGATGYLSATDYHLAAGAAAIGHGDPTSAPGTDHDGTARTTPTEAGAYEH